MIMIGWYNVGIFGIEWGYPVEPTIFLGDIMGYMSPTIQGQMITTTGDDGNLE